MTESLSLVDSGYYTYQAIQTPYFIAMVAANISILHLLVCPMHFYTFSIGVSLQVLQASISMCLSVCVSWCVRTINLSEIYSDVTS